MTYHPHAAKPELLQRRVIVNEESLSWRFSDTFDATNLNIEVREGKQQIQLYGEYYVLNKNGEGKFEIVVQKMSGAPNFFQYAMNHYLKPGT
ncbi:hypothetical protein CS369_14295 [Candidatus Symbiopectobacterium sp. 'North America']|uniref:hypothetical protein n=1 Tax=Candidatus Symbiopectobacterium sp. 'North America' TaxID=2794574 RepID=UPI001B356852|nr:hypothetical protein [Candidatus Symbiopectobacterium sp. 'North America']MBG6245658.1 hypothetical protein [Candidatus Symbiopectobacterium sp. 'North America']